MRDTEWKLEALRTENERLTRLLFGIRCVYCGEVVGQDQLSQDLADDVLRRHVEQCEKHPLNICKAELAAVRAENEAMKEDHKEFRQRYDDMTQEYEVKLATLNKPKVELKFFEPSPEAKGE